MSADILPFPETDLAFFDEWWKIQVHKTGKLICMQKWKEITGPDGCETKVLDKSSGKYFDVHIKATGQEIYEAQKRQNSAFFRENGTAGEKMNEAKKFLRRPQQYLNQAGWLDE